MRDPDSWLRRKLGSAYLGYVDDGLLAPARVEALLLAVAALIVSVRRPVIVGVTGSVGKSTVSKAILDALTDPSCVPFVGIAKGTVENMNNREGLPLTILGIQGWHRSVWERARLVLGLPWNLLRCLVSPWFPEIIVLEYGSDRSGYMAPMVARVPPAIAVITNIGHAHLEGMGGLHGVLEEKATLLDGVPAPRLVVIGDGHPFVDQLCRRSNSPTVVVGGVGIELAHGISRQVLAMLGVPRAIIDSLPTPKPPSRRFETRQGLMVEVIDDAFNANPTSVRYALTQFRSLTHATGRRVVVLGMMAELGIYSDGLHREIGAVARDAADLVVSVGPGSEPYGAQVHCADVEECRAVLATRLGSGDLVLVKGSAACRLDLVVEFLLALRPT